MKSTAQIGLFVAYVCTEDHRFLDDCVIALLQPVHCATPVQVDVIRSNEEFGFV